MLFDLAVFAAGIVFGLWAAGLSLSCYLQEKADSFARTPARIGRDFFYIVPEKEYVRRYPRWPKWEEEFCEVPPPGWYCTREKGHEGPCAAHPVERST